MKKLGHFFLIAAVALGLGATLWQGIRKQKEKPVEAAAEDDAGGKEEAPEAYGVRLKKSQWQALGLEKGAPEKIELRPQRMAFGRVLDPTQIVTLDGELAAAEAALDASRAENERTQKLLAAGENTSKKAAEAAQAQYRADEIKLNGLRRLGRLGWGALWPEEPTSRRRFVEQLVGGDCSLVRVDILPGDALTEAPKRARLVVLGRETQPVESAQITGALDVDPKTQAQGYFIRVDHPPFAFRPGMALTAWLELSEKPRAGLAIPRSAILRHDGRTWVYVQEEEENFVRKAVVLDTPLEGEKGWFLSADGGGINAEDLLVVTGAQSLLSEELKAQGGAEID